LGVVISTNYIEEEEKKETKASIGSTIIFPIRFLRVGNGLLSNTSYFITGDEVDETMWDHMGKEGQEINLTDGAEGSETLLSKLHGTPGIILMGVLIFMACLCLAGFLACCFERRPRPSTSIPSQPTPTTTTETTLTHTSVSITTTT